MSATAKSSLEAIPPLVLIVDDDPGQRSLLETFLTRQGLRTVTAASGEEALGLLAQKQVSMMISDVRMPGISGLQTLREARKTQPDLPILLVTAYADIRDAVAAMKDGALNYLSKPIDLDELLQAVRKATRLKPDSPPAAEPALDLPPDVVGRSPLMMALFRDAALVAPSESRVLITGESGVGKEILADLMHGWSRRASKPIGKINCAAIPEALLESELFGHEKGAFTGAVAQRIGRFEQAEGGTLFFDEIGEMSPAVQAKLLRVMNDGKFQRVGSNVERSANVRIFAATNKSLEDEVKRGRFREDLFYRLNVVELNIPPLRERREDIVPLAMSFISRFSGGKARFGANIPEILERYPWPGNIRELRNAMERAALVSRGELILPEHLPGRVRETQLDLPPVKTGETQRLAEVESETILLCLKKHDFNRTETAKALGISRRALLYKLQHMREAGLVVDPSDAG